jgi:hypothetical protein
MPSLTGITVTDRWIFNNGAAIFFKPARGETGPCKTGRKTDLNHVYYIAICLGKKLLPFFNG